MRASRVKSIFVKAVAQPESQRQALLERECEGDSALLDEIRALLTLDAAHADVTRRIRNMMSDSDADALSWLDSGSGPAEWLRLSPGMKVGPYTIGRPLGAGGSSSVYEAERAGLERPVALKVVHRAAASEHDRWRFEHEVRSLSRLEHPSIARVFDFGFAADSTPFIVTERIGTGEGEGRAMPFALAARRMDLRERLAMMLALCDAVSHAHQRGVIHRDLKSANVLVTVDAKGVSRPVIVDFGIARSFTPMVSPSGQIVRGSWVEGKPARRSSAEALSTTPGLVVGTVGTMAPEQAAGDPDAVDTRTDVWGLGVLLFEALTGQLPHGMPEEGPGGMVAWIARVQSADCRSVRSVVPSVAPDLDAIAAKALSRRREDRYVSAAALGEDIRRYLAGEPTRARPVSAFERAWKWTLRRKRAVAVGCVVLGLVVAAGASLALAARAKQREWAGLAENYDLLLSKVMGVVREAPASTEIRRLLVSETTSRLESDTKRRPDDPRLWALLAKARAAAADLAGESGNRERSLELHRASLADWTRALSLLPEDAETRLERTTQVIRVMDATPNLSAGERLAVIRETHREYEALWSTEPLASGTVPATALCWSYERLAALATQMDDREQAKAHRLRRIELAERIAERLPDHPDVMYNLAESYLCSAHDEVVDLGARSAAVQRAITAGEHFVRVTPGDRRGVHSLARALTMFACDHRDSTDPAITAVWEAAAARAEALALELWSKDPDDRLARWTLQTAAGERSVGRLRRGDWRGTVESADLCLKVLDRTERIEGPSRELSLFRETVERSRAAALAKMEAPAGGGGGE